MQFSFIRTPLHAYYKQIYIVLFIIFIQATYISFLTFSFKFIIDALIANNTRVLMISVSILCVGIIIIVALSIVRDLIYTRFVEDLGRDIRSLMFNHLDRLSIGYYSKNSTESILAHFSSDLRITQSALLSIPSGIIFPLFSLVTNIVALTILNWKLALFSLVLCPLILIGPHQLAKRLLKSQKYQGENDGKLMAITYESISMQNVIKAFRLFNFTQKKFEVASDQFTKTAKPVSFINALIERWGQIFPLVLQVVTLSVGVYIVYQKYITIGTLIAFQSVFGTLIYSLMGLTYSFANILQGVVGMKRLDDFFNEPEAKADTQELLHLTSFNTITFQDVSFGYHPDHYVLKNANFEIKKNQFVAFVGASGSGKSTILSLLAGFYEPSKGKILIDENDFNYVSKDSMRQLMSFVFQDPSLFNMTIKENILLGKLDASQKEVEEAAKAAEIHQTILEIHQGYDAPIGERGGHLSGGQKQRLSIARAMIAKPEILVLDEVTSALDPATEYAVNCTIDALSKKCTTISVTHRLDSIAKANCIFVLNNGEIIERGTHQELLELNGYYKSLWDKQHGFIIDLERDEVTITVERLKRIPLFQDLPLNVIEEILPLLKSVAYKKDQVIISEGDIGDMFYIIARGRVEIFRMENNVEDQIAMLEDGDYFGEIALEKKIPRTASAKALVPTLLLILYHADFALILDKNPQLREKIDKTILSRSKHIG